MFSTDANLLAFEPNLFRDVLWISQRLVDGQASVSGSILTMSSADAAFDAAGVTAGHVAFIGNAAYEVLERLSATTLRLSRPRADEGDPQIPVADITGPVAARVATFAPQRAMVATQLLRMLGMEPNQSDHPNEDDITNPHALTRAECLGTLHLIFAAAGSLTPADSPNNQRAEFYRKRFAKERERVTAHIDTDGDGEPDAFRTFNIFQLIRA